MHVSVFGFNYNLIKGELQPVKKRDDFYMNYALNHTKEQGWCAEKKLRIWVWTVKVLSTVAWEQRFWMCETSFQESALWETVLPVHVKWFRKREKKKPPNTLPDLGTEPGKAVLHPPAVWWVLASNGPAHRGSDPPVCFSRWCVSFHWSHCIHGKGIQPDISNKRGAQFLKNPLTKKDGSVFPSGHLTVLDPLVSFPASVFPSLRVSGRVSCFLCMFQGACLAEL